MKLFGKEISLTIKPAVDNDDPNDLRNHPNAIVMNRADQEKMKSILIDLVNMTQNLSKQDIKTWRSAWQRAIFVQNPKRLDLLRHYRDALIDNTLSGLILQRKLSTMQKVIKVVGKDGTEQEEKTKLLKKRWFRQFMNLVLDTPYYGHTLIQLGDPVKDAWGMMKFTDCKLIPREHVMPEYHVIIKSQQDLWQNGTDYTESPIRDWCIAVGEPDDLGLLLKAVPQTISIRHMEAFWDKFGELFGMPIRIGRTNSRDQAERNKIADMMTNMGSAAWGLFPLGTEIEIKETTRGDAYNVYDKRIERAENRLAYLILTESMTIKNGSSRSQGEVHLEQFEKVVKSDADMLSEVINEDLLPLMMKHGFPMTQDDRVIFDDTRQYSPTELTNLFKVVAQYYDVDLEFIQKTLQIPVTKRMEHSGGNQPDDNPVNFFD